MKKKIFLIIISLIILIIAGFFVWKFWPGEDINIVNWETYNNVERRYAIQYPKNAEIENLGYNVLGNVKISFGDNCYIGLDGAPAGFEDPDIKIDVTKDIVKIGSKKQERTFWRFLNRDTEDFAFINLDYPYDWDYPYFLIYHSANLECLPTINQILSTFKLWEFRHPQD